jgi:hypothetical protein
MYQPEPIDTRAVRIPAELAALIKELARHNHDLWAQQRMQEGWRYGARRDDARQEHPDLVPYADLPESEKAYDRTAAEGTIKAILAKGYDLVRRA